MCPQQSIAEREAALRSVREAYVNPKYSLRSVNEDEVSLLMAAAVADYETHSGGENIKRAVDRINGARVNERMSNASAGLQRRMKPAGLKAESGWLVPALQKMGLSGRLAAFSGDLLEAAAEGGLLIP